MGGPARPERSRAWLACEPSPAIQKWSNAVGVDSDGARNGRRDEDDTVVSTID